MAANCGKDDLLLTVTGLNTRLIGSNFLLMKIKQELALLTSLTLHRLILGITTAQAIRALLLMAPMTMAMSTQG
jgi:hypothetical protein